MIPWIMFLVTACLTSIGAVVPASVAIIAPVGLGFARRYNINPLMMGLLVINRHRHARQQPCLRQRRAQPEVVRRDIVNYINAKGMNPELKFWYAKVEHFQREVTAYGAALTGLDPARRLLGDDGYRVPEQGRVRNNRRALNRAG